MGLLSEPLDAFWLPARLRSLTSDVAWEVRDVVAGRVVPSGEGVTVRWPVLTALDWDTLLTELRAARGPAVPDLLARWQQALQAVPKILMRQPAILDAVARYTGYPSSMLMLALSQGDLIQLDILARAIEDAPTWAAARTWQRMAGGLPGALRFFPARCFDRWTAPLRGELPLFRPAPPTRLAVGFGAGNVPGNGLLSAIQLHIANHTTLGAAQEMPPGVLVRNSRQAPLLSPWVMSAVEQIDPELVAGLAMLIWEYDDTALQGMLLGEADLVMAAASDATIASIGAHLRAIGSRARFHRHGHKVSFAVIGRASLCDDLELLASLAAVDSTLWDQYGCLTARVHFVERGGQHTPADYAAALSAAMRELACRVPRGPAPLRLLHRAYDTYMLLERLSEVRVLTDYDDDCLVLLDERPWNPDQLRNTVNRCTGRVVVVRPVEDLSDISARYLCQLPPSNLQSVSVAVAAGRVLELAEAIGRCGVTALRCLGRAAFPKMAYSWDGLLPLDLGNSRPEGYFTTLEAEDPLIGLSQAAAQLGLSG